MDKKDWAVFSMARDLMGQFANDLGALMNCPPEKTLINYRLRAVDRSLPFLKTAARMLRELFGEEQPQEQATENTEEQDSNPTQANIAPPYEHDPETQAKLDEFLSTLQSALKS